MTRALIIETSTEKGLVALLEDDKTIFSEELPFGLNQSKFLLPCLQKVMTAFNLTSSTLSCVGVSVGPGSYTGIRIGVSVAKALAYAWRLPLIGFCSLEAFAPSEDARFAALIDAKIGGAYVLTGILIQGEVHYLSLPCVYSLNELGKELEGIDCLVAPYQKNLKAKIDHLYQDASWRWEETGPSAQRIGAIVRAKYGRKEWDESGQLDLLYLRKTEAEREKEKNSNGKSTISEIENKKLS